MTGTPERYTRHGGSSRQWPQPLPTLTFNCRLHYETPSGTRRQVHYKTQAMGPDIALDIAERMLRTDKRRAVACVTYGEAIQTRPTPPTKEQTND